jgi:transposase InsO family protein
VLHANAALTPRQRLRLARLIVDDGWPVARAAEWFQVSWPTAKRWAERYRQAGDAGMTDRSSRPHHSPARTPQPLVRTIVHLRCKQRLGPVPIARRVGVAPSTAHAVLTRCRINRLSHIDRRSREPVRRYERDRPGELVHIDVKKLGNIPVGGGHRVVGRAQGYRNKRADGGCGRNRKRDVVMGHAYVHAAIDDHTRLAYAEIHNDETAATATGFLRRATAWFAARGITIERVLTDNGGCYRSRHWRQTCTDLAITAKHTRPYRPQTNGKIERFNRTLAHEWAFIRPYHSEQARRAALPAWLHTYNHHRPHTAANGQPPITRTTNLPGQYT